VSSIGGPSRNAPPRSWVTGALPATGATDAAREGGCDCTLPCCGLPAPPPSISPFPSGLLPRSFPGVAFTARSPSALPCAGGNFMSPLPPPPAGVSPVPLPTPALPEVLSTVSFPLTSKLPPPLTLPLPFPPAPAGVPAPLSAGAPLPITSLLPRPAPLTPAGLPFPGAPCFPPPPFCAARAADVDAGCDDCGQVCFATGCWRSSHHASRKPRMKAMMIAASHPSLRLRGGCSTDVFMAPSVGEGTRNVVSVSLAVFWQNSCLVLQRTKAVSAQGHAVYCFADCELDVRERRLRVHGQPVTLTPKVFDTLVLLVERAGHVVSKDELMAALWPRGFVHESNLTKHIWLIRRALEDGDDESRYIETVPKLGYRFVAPLQSVAADANVNDAVIAPAPPIDTHPTTPIESRDEIGAPDSKRVRWLFAIVALALIVVFAAWFAVRGSHRGDQAATAPDPSAVAIVDFNNLSRNAKDAWLGPALEQMLATEVAANGKLHAVSEELVRPARADLPAPDAGGYAPSSLATLQRRLGAHYVLSGAYLVSGSPDAPQLRVDLIVQDAQSGAPFASLSRQAAVVDLPDLIARMGDDLRNRFGERSDPATLKQIASAQPASAEVARHLGFALQALDQYDAARARDELLQAIAQAPGYAPAYRYLARAWSMLGYRAKAIAAAKQAAQYADGLPREE